MPHEDAAEAETAQRKQALALTFDRLVESNLQLVKTVRAAIVIITICSVLSMTWAAVNTYSMRGTLADMRVMLQTVLDTLAKSRA